jgi:hypothetical protein
MDAITIEKIAIGLSDSGSGGSNSTVFEFYVLPSGSLPASPPIGSGTTSVIVPAAGAGNMNATTKDVSVALTANQILVVSISSAPDTLANYATVTLKVSA